MQMYNKKRLNGDWQSYEHYEVHCNKIQQTKLAMLPTKLRKNPVREKKIGTCQRKKTRMQLQQWQEQQSSLHEYS